jgi:hypothetical protein
MADTFRSAIVREYRSGDRKAIKQRKNAKL